MSKITLIAPLSNDVQLKPGNLWTMGNTSQQPPMRSPPQDEGATVALMRTGKGEFVITGDISVLRAYFEASPEQWLRCLALKGESKDG